MPEDFDYTDAPPLSVAEPGAPIFDDMAKEPPEVIPDPAAARREPRASKAVKGLGTNKQRGGPRAILKRDEEALTRYYILLGMGISPMRPQLGAALAAQAEECAKAWCDVAKENDSVRRVILWLVEGGAWGALLLAHLPIAIAAIPEQTWDRLPDVFKPAVSAFISPNGGSDTDAGQIFQFPSMPVRHPEAT